METRVVNGRKSTPSPGRTPVYIGRTSRQAMHWGNPFSHLEYSAASVRVKTREEAVANFRAWLDGNPQWSDIEPDRRRWILAHLEELRGHDLVCHCKPLACHGDVYVEKLEG